MSLEKDREEEIEISEIYFTEEVKETKIVTDSDATKIIAGKKCVLKI